ncbi:glycosyltransferase [uncultured Amnibacterium sp.]|uniref:glycosyltransferase n=1 Tax=uncultured Amnibacterium sp. TaxID=1631851 RepID=UPI0035CC38C5
MRVALVAGALRSDLDGVADYVLRLADELRVAGVAVRVVHSGPPDGPVPPGSTRVGDAWTPRAILRAAAVLRAADIVHVQFAPAMYRFRGGVGALPLALAGVPIVTTLHEYGWWRWAAAPAVLWQPLERARLLDRETGLLVPRGRRIVVTNPAHRAALGARFGDLRGVESIPIGANVAVDPAVDRPAARREVRAELGITAGATVLAFFGFVHPVKGVRYLVEALAALRAEGRDAHLLVVGGFESLALPAGEAAEFRAELEGRIGAAGVVGAVTITGFLPPADVSRLLAAADIAVLPFTAGVTTKSGSLLTVLAHGLPTIVTPGAVPDPELIDGATCVIASRVRDPAPIAAAVRRLDDPGLRQQVVDGARAIVSARSWPAIARRHLDLYRSVLS